MQNELGSTFSALAEPTRFRVVEALRGRQISASDLAAACSASGPAMSRHLRVLRRAGLIEVVPAQDPEQDARLRVYRLRREPFTAIEGWVSHMQTFWSGQLNAFKSYAEGKRRGR